MRNGLPFRWSGGRSQMPRKTLQRPNSPPKREAGMPSRRFARNVNLRRWATPIECPQSNGMAEVFVRAM